MVPFFSLFYCSAEKKLNSQALFIYNAEVLLLDYVHLLPLFLSKCCAKC